MVKCQSKKSESETGWAKKYGDGEGEATESSWASFIKRRRVGLEAEVAMFQVVNGLLD
jgi:hypothetical protein